MVDCHGTCTCHCNCDVRCIYRAGSADADVSDVIDVLGVRGGFQTQLYSYRRVDTANGWTWPRLFTIVFLQSQDKSMNVVFGFLHLFSPSVIVAMELGLIGEEAKRKIRRRMFCRYPVGTVLGVVGGLREGRQYRRHPDASYRVHWSHLARPIGAIEYKR